MAYRNQAASRLFRMGGWVAAATKTRVSNRSTNDLDQRLHTVCGDWFFAMDWKPIDTAPFDRDLELAVIDGAGVHALSFSCVFRRLGQCRNQEAALLHSAHPLAGSVSLPAPSVASAHGESVRTSGEVLTERLAAIHRPSSRVNNP